MIWEVTLADGAVYGPTHANAVRVFVREGQILPKDTVRDIVRGEKFLAGEFELYLEKQYPLAKAEPPPEPQTIAASSQDAERKSDTRLKPIDETRKKDFSKTRLRPIEDDDVERLEPEELKERVHQLLDALKSEQSNYEKLKQHYQDLNQRFVDLKDRFKAIGGATDE
jgi:FtsZ-binding cell division protein ZapB